MFAKSLAHGTRRRGIILVLILGMLGLLALIGVTFATYAGQALVNARNSNIAEGRPNAEAYMDFALGQLINDTSNPLSAIRGHSLLRDMYGNDSVFRGTTAADYGGLLSSVTQASGATTPLQFGSSQTYSNSANQLTPALAVPGSASYPNQTPYYQYQTNIPTAKISYQYYGLNFTRWIVRIYNATYVDANKATRSAVSQTFEVIEDDDTGTDMFSGGNHLLTLSPIDPGNNPDGIPGTYIYTSPLQTEPPGDSGNVNNDKYAVHLSIPGNGTLFSLDGRFMSAFNGPGMSRPLIPVPNYGVNPPFPPLVPFNVAAYANFKYNGYLTNPANDPTSTFPTSGTFGDPDLIGLDEDYDACDLENWFLALQSADGQVMIPSFHRPSILTSQDWTSGFHATNTNIQNMNAVAGVAKILRPRQIDNAPQFPADPSTPDPQTGKITYDIDNDGDGVTDSVWLDLGYPVQKDVNSNKLFKPLFAFMVIGENGRLPLNTVGNLQDRDAQYFQTYTYTDPTSLTVYTQLGTAATFYDAPTWTSTSHVGASVNEINPTFALQNAPAGTYSANVIANGVPTGVQATATDYNPNTKTAYYSQVDNAGIDIAITQLRNILAGTVPMDNLLNPSSVYTGSEEGNFVYVNGQQWWVPNGVIDAADPQLSGNVPRTSAPPVAGRWGEPEGISKYLTLNGTIYQNLGFVPPNIYLNPVRAGRSFYSSATITTADSFMATSDLMDDDLDSATPAFGSANTELNVNYDTAGQVSIPSQRMRRYGVPTDPSGNGQLIDYMSRPVDIYDHGTGSDVWGRVGFFRYFRPPGLPHTVTYPAIASADSAYSIEQYKMPVFGTYAIPDNTNNQYHSFEAAKFPSPSNRGPNFTVPDLLQMSVMGAMPFDYTANLTGTTDPTTKITTYTIFPNTPPTLTTSTITLNGANIPVTFASSESGPYLLGNGSNVPPNNLQPTNPITYAMGALDNSANPGMATIVNGYPGGSLNKDEADEMNLYSPNRYDQPYGPSDLEWLYRKQDVDGSTLSSRLSSLAPVSFLNPADGQTRRRLFSVDSWEPNNYVWANDNPLVFNPAIYINNLSGYTGPSSQPLNPYNSRFAPLGNASFAAVNQIPTTTAFSHFGNANTFEMIPNPLLLAPIIANATYTTDVNLNPNPDTSTNNYITFVGGAGTLPVLNGGTLSPNAIVNTSSPHYPNLINGYNSSGNQIAYPVDTPPLAHRDRRINLNMPLPIAADPTEPVRQKWCRDAYQMLKAILPPQAVDTPQELAALSQYVVNIIDFRDPDATMTRFVNTDLMVVPASSTSPSSVKFAEIPVPVITTKPLWDAGGNSHTFFAYDPMIANEQTEPSANWITAMSDTTNSRARPNYLVQYGMEYNPIAINEVLAYSFYSTSAALNTVQSNNYPTPRLYIELVNTSVDDTSHVQVTIPTTATSTTGYGTAGTATVGSGDMDLAGWDLIITPDTDAQGRPDPITGNIPALTGMLAGPAYASSSNVVNVATAGAIDPASLSASGFTSTVPPTSASAWTGVTPPNTAVLPTYSYGWSLDSTYGFYLPVGGTFPDGVTVAGTTPSLSDPTTMICPNGQVSYIPALRSGGPLTNTNGFGYPTLAPTGTNPTQLIGDGYFILGNFRGVPTPANTNGSNPLLPNGAMDRVPAIQSSATVPSYADFVYPNKFFIDNTVTSYTIPQPAPQQAIPPGNQYYWLYLRRPANPFNPSSEMVVVDSFRFPFIVNRTKGQSQIGAPNYKDLYLAGDGENPTTLTNGSNEFFSLQRLQPYRGGHHVPATPPMGWTAATAANPTGGASGPTQTRPLGHTWGYTEQTMPPMRVTPSGGTASPAPPAGVPAAYGPNNPLSNTNNSSNTTYYVPGGLVFDTMGTANLPADAQWDFFPFHDRDFNSVAELLLVPGCPPGLFTKEFSEQNFSFNPPVATYTPADTTPNLVPASFPSPYGSFTASTNPAITRSLLPQDTPLTSTVPHTFPYLNDEFYYTAVSVNPSTDTNDLASIGPYPTQLGGWTGTGWYKMLDFFEVPSSANGAVGSAAAGENFDWFRNDQRPGLLNLNLIIDEEVFFGLLDDPRINIALAQYGHYLNNYYYQTNVATSGAQYNVTSPLLPGMATLPQIISQVDYYGNPTLPGTDAMGNPTNRGYYDLSDPTNGGGAITSLAPGFQNLTSGAYVLNNNSFSPSGGNLPLYFPPTGPQNYFNNVGRGFSYMDPAYSYAGMGSASTFSQNVITGMKAAFSDFLKLRHGGTNFLFGHQAPNTPPGMLALAMDTGLLGSVNPTQSANIVSAASPNSNNVWPDRPYRSLSYPDINFTVMRPALMPPSVTQFSMTLANQVYGTSPMTFPGPYYYDFNPTLTGNNSPIQSSTLAAMYTASGNSPNFVNPSLPTTGGTYTGDPGIRFPWLDLTFTNMANYNASYSTRLTTTIGGATTLPAIPPIPPRRLFAPPDSAATSNAGTKGDNNVNNTTSFLTGIPNISMLANNYLADPYAELITQNTANSYNGNWSNFTPQPPNTTVYNPSILTNGSNPVFGANYTQQNFVLTNRRQVPYYRTELLQKVMNQTTVRTHQFAVWITVGFFEVVHVGTPELGLPDILGAELNAAAGNKTRYRSFFVIDRTKAAGFNPYYPGEFRNCVTYRRRIE